MNTQNSCYTYFKIVGNFDPDYISKLLGLVPERSHKIGDTRKNGTKYDFALWTVGKCDEYDPMIENQMRKTISVLKDKIPLLCRIKQDFDVDFYLEIVPTVYADDVNPCLAPSLDIIDFCHETRTKIDIDLYVCNANDK